MSNEEKYKGLDFGSYCIIEQKRYGTDNEFHQYKVIGVGDGNYAVTVPVDGRDRNPKIGKIRPVVKAIHCGVDETNVETFNISDVEPLDYSKLPFGWAAR